MAAEAEAAREARAKIVRANGRCMKTINDTLVSLFKDVKTRNYHMICF